MQRSDAERLSRQLLGGDISHEQFLRELLNHTAVQMGEVTLDVDRQRRCGFPEVIYGQGKTPDTLEKICRRLSADGTPVLVTRVGPDTAQQLLARLSAGRYNEVARTFRVQPDHGPSTSASDDRRSKRAQVAIVTAGTSDLPVAEEARETLDWMGITATMIHDVGVAGPHRLSAHLDKLETADAVVVVAGMEGALPSVVGGYVSCPVIAVPTSTGYGASFGGIAALLGMLNSCAANVTVVNIDAGFKGAYVAGLIALGTDKKST